MIWPFLTALILSSASLFSFGFNTVSVYADLCFWQGHTFHTSLEESYSYKKNISMETQKCSIPMSPGFRLGTSYFMYGEYFVFDANWNRFHVEKNLHDFNFDTIDVSFGYTLYRNYLVTLRGFFGVEGAFLKKNFQEEDSIYLKEIHQFKGAGPLLGLLFQWDIGAGFTIETLGAFASPFGHATRQLNVLLSTPLVEHVSDHHVIGISDFRCGLRYTFPFLSWYGVNCFLGFEQRAILGNHVGSGQSLTIKAQDGSSLLTYKYAGGGRITLIQGVTFSTDFSF